MKIRPFISLLVVATGISTGSATLIFSDNFNTPDNADLNQNLATRQSGSIGNQNWVEPATNSGIQSNALAVTYGGNAANDGNVYLNYDFSTAPGLLAGGQFTVSFDMTATANYSAFYIGGSALTGRPVINAGTDFGFLMKSTSGSSVYRNGSSTGTATVGTGQKSYEFTVTTSDFNSGTAYTIDLLKDSAVYDLNGAGAGTSLAGTWDGGSVIMGFSARNSPSAVVDNFAVTAIPEPSSLLLFLIPAFSFYLLRHRKA